MMYILLVLIVLAWSVRGIEQAVLWSRKGHKAFKWNEHLLFVISRGLYIAIIITATFIEWYWAAGIAGVSILMFPIVHNGFYYVARNRIAETNGDLLLPYPEGFMDYSEDSSAAINFTWKVRLVFAIVGLALLTLLIILK